MTHPTRVDCREHRIPHDTASEQPRLLLRFPSANSRAVLIFLWPIAGDENASSVAPAGAAWDKSAPSAALSRAADGKTRRVLLSRAALGALFSRAVVESSVRWLFFLCGVAESSTRRMFILCNGNSLKGDNDGRVRFGCRESARHARAIQLSEFDKAYTMSQSRRPNSDS